MECGADDFCHIIDVALNNTMAVKEAFDHLDALWRHTGIQIGDFLKERGEKLIALTSLVFAFWRWWVYRERILYKRLEDFVRENDRRIVPSTRAVVEAIARPSSLISLPQPAFAVELRRVLTQNDWRQFFSIRSLEEQAERQIGQIMSGIRKRERIIALAERSLREQRAQAHLLAGAIYSARARAATGNQSSTRDDHRALREFQSVLASPGHVRDVAAKEFEAFQFLRLGKWEQATAAYEDLETFALEQADARQRDLTVARSKRYRAQIIQCLGGQTGRASAWDLIANENRADCAVALRSRNGAYSSWDQIEDAETHLVAAFVAHYQSFTVKERAHLEKAAQAYRDVLYQLPTAHLFMSRSERRLKEEAETGLQRVQRAQSSDFDWRWLTFGSKQP